MQVRYLFDDAMVAKVVRTSIVDDAALAIAAVADRLDKLDLVWLFCSELHSDGHTLKNTEGKTPVRDLVKAHVDICSLDYVQLGKIVNRVNIAIQDEQFYWFTKTQIKNY